jgi:hypothetical protein
MPLSAGQSTQFARQKSCEACKSAKRRCDLSFPACSRCIHRGIPCFYPGRLPQICAEVIADIPVSTNYDEMIDSAFTPYNCDSNLMTLVNTGPLHPIMIDSPFRHINIISPENRVDIFEGISSSHNFDLVMKRANPPKQLSDVLANRLQFAVDVLQNIPEMVVTENQTPWSHRQLYKSGMPKDMQGRFIKIGCYHYKLSY